jgi:solute carrier family 13 (sodium-dependent dicarboxylate transporter), member 2/3/5
MSWTQRLKILSGPLAFIACLLYAPYAAEPLTVKTLGVAAWLVLWWILEAAPMGATSLLPLILLPAIDIGGLKETARSYGDPVIFLFMGGFIIAIAMEKWNLHKRIALSILKLTGTNANGIVLGFMIATAFISMWISNTAATVMMLPIGLSVIKLVEGTLREDVATGKGFKNFSSSIMMGIAYAASIGGIGTIIGTPPNMVMTGFMKNLQNFDMPFLDWMYVGVPIVILLIAFTYFITTRWLLKNSLGKLGDTRQLIQTELEKLGKISYEQKVIAIVFAFTVTLWVGRLFFNHLFGSEILHDTTIALIGGLLFFIIPAKNKKEETADAHFLLSWHDIQRLPWHILLLFGGGFALAAAVENVGIIDTVGHWVASIKGIDAFVLVTLLAAAGVYMSEIMGNVALATIYIPVAMGIGASLGQSPILFAIPIAISTTYGFMLPIATPPNAIAYGSGYINSKDMLKVGGLLNLFGIVVLYFITRYWLPMVFSYLG